MRLKRTALGPIKLDRLPRGKSRKLKADEIERLRRATQRKQRPAGAPAPEERPQEPAKVGAAAAPLHRRQGARASKRQRGARRT
jgi:23S rRNA pseudouridine2605 synthase